MSRLRSALTDLALPAALAAPLHSFGELFLKWNKSINLSAARTAEDVLDHVVDSLHVVPHLRQLACSRVLDVGAGGGLPCVVAAICLPDVAFTALEPVHKKHAFLRTAARELTLDNLDPLAQRLDDHPGRDYDAAMSRATFDVREWLLMGLTHVKPGGVVLGFEAVPRLDLPADTVRASYDLDGKSRAIVALRRPQES